ncbi:MAG: AmmeMemoRadiSam system protein A [Desulfuromonadaceae bacterium]|nr:AmmeMemoRadiSam system protein A [Desulfuromonadaceae bacterium]
MNQQLNVEEQKILLKIARDAITAQVCNGVVYVEPREEMALNSRSGCFVTIKKGRKLRGCIGNFQSEKPLFKEVAEMAIVSATQDPRFTPMTTADLNDFFLEISVLGPLEKIESIDEISIGRDGIYLEKNYHRGVLLPQVATENGWDRETFLRQTCVKAGLPVNAWQDDNADIYIFNAQIFNDDLFPPR